MKTMYNNFVNGMEKLRDLLLLLFRLVLAVGFWEPAMMQLKHLSGIAEWYGSMNYPIPGVLAPVSMVTEVLGIILLTLGLGSRLAAMPMMFVMIIATFTIHLPNGFAAGDNGFEIPLYYFVMLFSLVVYGSGKYSVDYLLTKRAK